MHRKDRLLNSTENETIQQSTDYIHISSNLSDLNEEDNVKRVQVDEPASKNSGFWILLKYILADLSK